MTNRYGHALARAQRRPAFLNLIDTNFHSCGLFPPEDLLRQAADRYLAEKHREAYAPDPAGSRELRDAIAAWYSHTGWQTDAAELLVTASASESYSHIFSTLLRPGSEVLLPSPGYPLFEEVARRRGLVPRFYRLAEEDGWQIDQESVRSAVGPQTGCIVIISPNNPTGAVVSATELQAVADEARKCGALLLVDEVFSEFHYGPDPQTRAGARFPDVRCCTIHGASKLFASPDLKVSWIRTSGPREWRAEAQELLEIENDLYLNGSSLSQALVTWLFLRTENPGAALAAEVATRRGTLDRALTGLSSQLGDKGITIDWTPPAGGIHLPVRIRGLRGVDDEELCVRALEEVSLNLHPGYLYGFEGSVAVVSFLCPHERIESGVRRLGELLSSLG
jgi:aspartate/methionine/tyrosine aminotransferase